MTVRRREKSVCRQLRGLYDVGTIGGLSDGQLLERFATDGNEMAELAFAALVERHERMVWHVCLAILRDEHDAQDAFQATFLVLVRRARSLWVRDSLGPWLHQVACRTSSCLRGTVIRRRKHERRSAERNSAQGVEMRPKPDLDRDEAIHSELNGLPEKYRAPLVLCDLEGRTHQEAARFLGWPIGTLKSRQSVGRRMIRERLARRGFGLAVLGVAGESLRQSAFGALPERISSDAVSAAMQLATRSCCGAGASIAASTLARGVIRAMLWSKLRYAAVIALAVAITSGGGLIYVRGSQEPESKAKAAKAASKPVARTKKGKDVRSKDEATAKSPAPPAAAASLRAQQYAVRRAKIAYEIAVLNRELAEIAAEEHKDLIYPRDLAATKGEIYLAESELSRALDRVDWAQRMFLKGFVPMAQKVSEELALKKARFTLEQSQSKLKVLEEFTKAKTIKELESEIKKATSDELAKKATWTLESGKEKKLERELKARSK